MKRWLLIAILLAGGGFGAWRWGGLGQKNEQTIPESSLFAARRGPLTITVTENGYLKAKNSVSLKPKFRRQGTITWLVEEGSTVAEEDVLVEFDKTDLQNQISELDNKLIQYETELGVAKANLAIQERDNEASVEKAELALQLARLAQERYEQGEAPNELRKKKLAKEKAESELKRAEERYQRVPELLQEGFLTKIQVEEERILLREAEITLENADRELSLYETYTTEMELTQKQADVRDGERELQNAREKAVINLDEKQARVTQQERQVSTTQVRLDELEEELGHMTLHAPQPGIVHYGDPERPWRRDEVKVGNTVRQGNTLITLPDLSEMQILVQVHEADIDLVKETMPVFVTIETHKGRRFTGKVTEIASVASSQNWTDDSNKTFKVEVTMDAFEEKLRAGVTAKVEILIEEIEDVLQVPIHSVLAEEGEQWVYVWADGKSERRTVEIGKNNAHYVEVLSGLEAGERVLLYDPRDSGLPGGGDLGAGSGAETPVSTELTGMEGTP